MKKTFAAALILFAVLFTLTDAALAKTVRINKPRIRAEVAPGVTHDIDITVTNPTEEPVEIRSYVEDWKYNEQGNGDKDFFPPGTLPASSSTWISFTPAEFTVPAFSESVLSMTITVPDNLDGAVGTYNSILFFETTLGYTQNDEGATVRVAGRIGSLIYCDIEGTVIRNGKIDDIRVTPGKGAKPTLFEVDFTNTGNTSIPLEGEFIIFDQDGGVAGRGELEAMYSSPGMSVTRSTEWAKRLKPGTYDFVFTFDMGDGQALVEERQLEV